MTKKAVALHLRFKLFAAVISPAIWFGLATLLLDKSENFPVNKFQRKMFRLIVGWARHDGEDWSDTMSRMNRRIVFAMSIRECKPWFSQIFKKQFPSQPKYSIRVILGPQQPASGIQPVSGSKTCPLNPNVGKVVHQNNRMTILKKNVTHYFRVSWATAARVQPKSPFLEHLHIQFCSNIWPMNPSHNPCKIEAARTGAVGSSTF